MEEQQRVQALSRKQVLAADPRVRERRRRLLERARDERFGWGASGPVRQGGNCTLPKTSAPHGVTNVQPPFFATVGHRQPPVAGSTFYRPGTRVALAPGRYIASSPETEMLPPRLSRRPSEGKARPTKGPCTVHMPSTQRSQHCRVPSLLAGNVEHVQAWWCARAACPKDRCLRSDNAEFAPPQTQVHTTVLSTCCHPYDGSASPSPWWLGKGVPSLGHPGPKGGTLP